MKKNMYIALLLLFTIIYIMSEEIKLRMYY